MTEPTLTEMFEQVQFIRREAPPELTGKALDLYVKEELRKWVRERENTHGDAYELI